MYHFDITINIAVKRLFVFFVTFYVIDVFDLFNIFCYKKMLVET